MAGRCIYVFGNGALAFDDFLRLYVPPIEQALAEGDARWAVCDFRGVDTLTMEYLKSRTAHVTVFHVGAAPRYLPDRSRGLAGHWQLQGGFAGDTARDDAALAAATHFLAIDRFATPERTTGTAAIIERARAAGRIAVIAQPERAVARGRVDAEIARAPVHPTARSFARILLDLFPPWFDFAPEHLAVLRWSMGLHLVVSGPGRPREARIALISTSDSRGMSVSVHAGWQDHAERADISMHYTPDDAALARARTAIALALHALFPDQPVDPSLAPVIARLPRLGVFPDALSSGAT